MHNSQTFSVHTWAAIFVHLGAEGALKMCVRVRVCVKHFFGADVHFSFFLKV